MKIQSEIKPREVSGNLLTFPVFFSAIVIRNFACIFRLVDWFDMEKKSNVTQQVPLNFSKNIRGNFFSKKCT